MKVLMVGPHKKYGGGMSTLIQNYYNSKLVSLVKLYYIPTTIRGHRMVNVAYFFFACLRFMFYIAFLKVDIVHIHTASRGSFKRKRLLLEISKLFLKKVILHIHSGEFTGFYHNECSLKKQKSIRKSLDKADMILALSRWWKEEMMRITSAPIEVLYNFLAVNKKNLYNVKSTDILFMGNLSRKKGIYDILAAAPFVVRKYPSVQYVMCGRGDIDEIMKRAKDLDISENIKLTGWLCDWEKEDVFRKSVMLLLPSYYEGMPMVILEAFSYGIPVIATNVGGIPEMIEHGVNGYLIRPGDYADLAKYILRLIEDKELRRAMSQNAFKTCCEKFNIENNIIQLFNIYQRVLR